MQLAGLVPAALRDRGLARVRDLAHNSSLRKVILSGSGADRTLTVPALHGLDGPDE